MKYLPSILLGTMTLGCKADIVHHSNMVYGFDNVSLRICRTTACMAFYFPDQICRLNHQTASCGRHVLITLPALGWKFL